MVNYNKDVLHVKWKKLNFSKLIKMSSKEQVKETEKAAKDATRVAEETKQIAKEVKANARGPGRPPKEAKKK